MREIARGVLALLLLLAAAGHGVAQQSTGERSPRAEMMRQFEASMEKFEALAEAMPASTYGWSPAEGVMPVARVFAHVARYNFLYPSESLGATLPSSADLGAMESVTDREQLIALLERSGEFVRRVAAEGSDADWEATTELYGRQIPRWGVLLQLVTHMNEHLGQSIAYARMNGVVPPWSR